MNEKYCRECGKKVVENCEICPGCGCRVKTISVGKTKKKSTAVILAVLFSYWTWLYTAKRDLWKFWVGLSACIIGVFFLCIPNLAIFIWSILDTTLKDADWYENFHNEEE